MFNFFNVPLIFFIYNIVTRRKEELPMRKKYVVILTGIIFSFVILSGCGMNRDVQRTQQPDNGSTQTEEELQAEIDALQQQIDELKTGSRMQGALRLTEIQRTAVRQQTAHRHPITVRIRRETVRTDPTTLPGIPPVHQMYRSLWKKLRILLLRGCRERQSGIFPLN